MAFDFPVLINWTIFSMDLLHVYLTFPVMLPINECSPHNNEQFGGGLIKIKQILGILQGF